MDNEFVLSAPIAFVILLAVCGLLYFALGSISYKKGTKSHGQTQPYACGEEQPTELPVAEYSQFFPFAFFFTILHVVALTVATFAVATAGNIIIAAFYVVSALVGLTVLYRSE
jgi:NADH:ubiquinone oxidoreductase subunit 3 (subunit A)